MLKVPNYLDCKNIPAHGVVNLPHIRQLIKKMQLSHCISTVLKELHSPANAN